MPTLHEQTAGMIAGIAASRNAIRNKLIELGLATSTDMLDKLATAIESIVDQGAITAQVKEGETYTIPKGFHNGNGTVSGVSGGGNYNLQSKTVTPTKQQQAITPDSGYYGLSDVKVAPIPSAYQDVSSVTAEQGHVLAGKVVVLSDGRVVAGTMENNGTVSKVLDTTTVSYTLEVGYYTGGTISIVLEEKNVTPTKSAQTITPTSGKVLSKVTVNPIPDNYVDKTGAQAISMTIDPLTQDSVSIAEGYTLGGTVSLTDDLYKALAAI
jgi:hypothetical protein